MPGLKGIVILTIGLLPLLAAEAPKEKPTAPKSPKATDTIRVNAAAIDKAKAAYWNACAAADRQLSNVLKTAADAAHDRNDGTEETACREARKDIETRALTESLNAQSRNDAGPITPMRFEKKN